MFTQKHLFELLGENFISYCKTIGNISLEDLFDTDAVYACAIRASQGFANKADTQRFMEAPMYNSYILALKVINEEFVPQYYRVREIDERGKTRTIQPPTFETKVVQKAVCTYLMRPLLEPKMISTNYATISGRGTDRMFEDILQGLNRHRKDASMAIVMTDFSNYFGNLAVGKVMNELSRYIRDERIIRLIRKFSPDEKGLPLGNELSQLPATWYPSAIDHYMKDRLGIREYYRYMDDTLAIIPQCFVDEYVETFEKLSVKLGLILKPSKIKIIKNTKPFIFCKERFYFGKNDNRYYRIINPKRETNEKRKLRKYKELIADEKMSYEEAENQYRSVKGAIKNHPNSRKTIKRLDQAFENIEAVQKIPQSERSITNGQKNT